MFIFPNIALFLLGLMLGYICLMIIKRSSGAIGKSASVVLSILSGSAVLKLSGADQTMFFVHYVGLFSGWIFWIFVAISLGAPKEFFYSSTQNVDDEQHPKKSKFY